MTYLVAALFGLAVAFAVTLVARLIPSRPRAVARQLAELERMAAADDGIQKEGRQRRSRELKAVLTFVGEKVDQKDPVRTSELQELMIHAGYREPGVVPIYWGARVVLTAGLGIGLFLLVKLLGADALKSIVAGASGAALGFVGPAVHVGGRARRRQKDLQRTLPDALDLLIVCVEAGLALNQALVRVAEEIRHVSRLTSEEFSLVNFEIRAGVPRDEALKNLAKRTGVADIGSLTAMLIQTDRFGTSIAQALRVHSDTLRTKRRQRAEEAAAKTTIKLVFPLACCIFPALFVVILGPAMVEIYRTLLGMK
ncbi:MAG TPA: type II secretion system F family protein [Gemmatimonadales bacterium]|nr:type II secretion system F family protein [Gemmatimonadales bacterium]